MIEVIRDAINELSGENFTLFISERGVDWEPDGLTPEWAISGEVEFRTHKVSPSDTCYEIFKCKVEELDEFGMNFLCVAIASHACS